jgi:hypothetical protein
MKFPFREAPPCGRGASNECIHFLKDFFSFFFLLNASVVNPISKKRKKGFVRTAFRKSAGSPRPSVPSVEPLSFQPKWIAIPVVLV